jgi:hypothetical protein
MLLTGEDRSTYRKTLSSTNSTWAGLGLKPPFQGKIPISNCLSHGEVWEEVVLADLLEENKKKKNKKTVVSLLEKLNPGHPDYESGLSEP